MTTYIRPFGDNKILFTETEGRLDFALTPVVSIVNQNPSGTISETLFTNSSNKIIIGGLPITLSQYEGFTPSEFSTGNEYFGYAINIILNRDTIPINSNPSFLIVTENSFVWKGNRLTLSQDENFKSYMDVFISAQQNITPYYKTTINGIQLTLNIDRELILYDSGYDMSHIEEYIEFAIGGAPLTAGRIKNDWYFIVSSPKQDKNIS